MGQGTESCGGYDHDFNPYDEGLAVGIWTMRDGSTVSVSKMTIRHIRGAIRACERAMRTATFSCDADMWEEWVEVFNEEIELRRRRARETTGGHQDRGVTSTNPSPVRGTMVKMKCHCGNEYTARLADIKRGWAMSCSKRCAAVRRTYGKRKATLVEG